MSEYAEAYFDECMALKRELREQRNAVIEECVAQVVETMPLTPMAIDAITAALRALKDKP